MYKYLSSALVITSLLAAENYTLSDAELKSIQMAKKWINNNTKIVRQPDGSLGFHYGDNMPTLVCRPLNATIIKLKKGEQYKDLRTGDSERWKFDVVENATDGRTFVLVKPVKANIMTNLIIFTDERIYNIKLISSNKDWIPAISFIYGNETSHETPVQAVTKVTPAKAQASKPNHHKKRSSLPKKRSEYSISSDGWKPNRIFTQKGKTYIDIGSEDAARLRLYVTRTGRSGGTATYRHQGKYLVVDTIVKKAILVKDGFGKTIIHIRRQK